MASITKKDRSLLATIVAAMAVEATPYHMATLADVKKLSDAKFVETNDEIKDGDKVAVRATEAAVAENAKSATTTPAASTSTIAIMRAGSEGAPTLDLSAFAKRPRTSSNYDFDSMNVGDSFFIEATEARPNPAKSIASTVSAATKKYADKPEAEQRVYAVAPFTAGEAKGGYTATTAGALIVRTK